MSFYRCGHCKSLAPVYEELAGSFEFAKDKVTIAKVDADAEKELGKRFGISGFPTLKWFDGKKDDPEDYKSGRDIESLSAFVTEKTGIKPKGPKKPESAVKMLTDDNWEAEIGKDKDVIVAFTAPWCGREYHTRHTRQATILSGSSRLQEPRSYMGTGCSGLRSRIWRDHRKG